MTDRETQDLDGDVERIREEAAGWVARLEGRGAPSRHPELDTWLAADPRHAAAYRRIGQRFEGARVLRSSHLYADRSKPAWRPRHSIVAAAAFAVAAVVLILLLPMARLPLPQDRVRQTTPAVVAGTDRLRFDAVGGTVRSIGLEDGSVVTLDGSSAVEVAFARDARQVRLLRGRARFTVAHDGRPFTVVAGGGTVTARGTVFDVSLSPGGQVSVTLLRGVVDVAPVAASSSSAAPPVRRLLAGDAVAYAGSTVGSVIAGGGSPSEAQWADRAVDFDNVSLAYLLDRANQTATTPVRLADPALASLRVSGRFEVGDTERMAYNLARLFDLRVEGRADTILLRRN